jgi:hypothetical protein
MELMTNPYKILVRTPEGKRLFRRSKYVWGHNTKMGRNKIEWAGASESFGSGGGFVSSLH